MKLLSKLSIIAGATALAAPMLTAQTTEVATIPVGVVEKVFPAGSSVIAPLFVNSSAFQGASTSLTEGAGTTTINFGSSVFSAGEFDEGSDYPTHYVEVVGGSNEGFAFDIISNTESSITVTGLASTDIGIGQTEVFVVRPHVTVAQFFEGATGLSDFADGIKFFNGDGSSDIYLYEFGDWNGSAGNANLRQIYPGTGVLVVFSSPVTVTSTGTVKNTATQIPVFANINTLNLIASGSPVEELLGDLDLASQLVDFAEGVKFFEPSTLDNAGIYLAEFGTFGSGDSEPVIAGDSFLLTVSTDKYVKLPAPYTE